MTTLTFADADALDRTLVRSVAFELREDADPDDGLTLEGYAAVFAEPTRINSWEGIFDEQVARGAFKKSLQERTPVLQFDHGRHPLVGSIPLGSFDRLREDAQGLEVAARLHDNWLVQPVRDAIRSRSIPGMSFRFEVVKDDWRDARGRPIKGEEDVARAVRAAVADDPSTIPTRTLREVKLFELGPVVFPAYPQTSVSVRNSEHVDLWRRLLNDPQNRAELALALVGTPPPSSGTNGVPDEGRAASPEEPPAALPAVPSIAVLVAALRLEGVLP